MCGAGPSRTVCFLPAADTCDPAALLSAVGVSSGGKRTYTQKVERQTLARQCPTLLTLLKSFPISLTLQEPTFKDLVVVYRWVGVRVCWHCAKLESE